MSLFSFLHKNKQESASDDSAFSSRAEEASKAVRNRSKRKQADSGKQDDESMDPVLPEKKRARRRLIGAVALVLAAIIGLPMVLDSEPKQLADDIVIQIPSKDMPASAAGVRPLNPSTTSQIAASATLDPKEEVIEPSPALTANDKQEELKPATTTVAPAAMVTADAKPEIKNGKSAADVTKTADKANLATSTDVKAEAKAETKAVEKADDAARAKALLEGKSDPKTAEKKPGKFVIQVAALATKEKIDELQNKLNGAGIKSFTQKVATESGDRTRIRVGPFSSKEEAEKMRAKIGKLGLNGTLVPA